MRAGLGAHRADPQWGLYRVGVPLLLRLAKERISSQRGLHPHFHLVSKEDTNTMPKQHANLTQIEAKVASMMGKKWLWGISDLD